MNWITCQFWVVSVYGYDDISDYNLTSWIKEDKLLQIIYKKHAIRNNLLTYQENEIFRNALEEKWGGCWKAVVELVKEIVQGR